MASEIEKKISEHISQRKSFVLDAGAGSGKTYTLVQTLNNLISAEGALLNKKNQIIICITYTKVARDEILERIDFNEMVVVKTIHDFLWDVINRYQNELVIVFKEYLGLRLSKYIAKRDGLGEKAIKGRADEQEKIDKLSEKIKEYELISYPRISYTNYPKYQEGRISHDDLLEITNLIFSRYPRISKLVSDKYPFIFVDEYQDTQNEVIQVLLDHLNKNSNQVIGFFGDKKQQIYETGIGEIPSEYGITNIQKRENYRCSKQVINVLNNIRTDLTQFQPEQNNKIGEALFFDHSKSTDFQVESFVKKNLLKRWRLNSSGDVKALYLTHRYISKEKKYDNLFDLCSSNNKRDSLIDNDSYRGFEPIIDFLYDSERIIDLYKNNRIKEMLYLTAFTINSFNDRRLLRDVLNQLICDRSSWSIGKYVDFIVQNKILEKNERHLTIDFEKEEVAEFYTRFFNLNYQEFINLFQVQAQDTPYSTKHGTKGAEYENVLVVIDDSAWKTNYSFDNYFSDQETSEKRLRNTQNLFYVVCSRAEYNLAVVCTSSLSSDSITKLENWFGTSNIITVG